MKYEPLKAHLSGLSDNEWKASFSEIERVLGFKLPGSARMYRPWWGNQGGKSGHSHALAWGQAGWKTSKVDMELETVVFVKEFAGFLNSSELEPNKTVGQKIKDYLQEHPEGATNVQMAEALSRSAPHIYQEVTVMERRGVLESVKEGRAKRYFLSTTRNQGNSALSFQNAVRSLLEGRYNVLLEERRVGDIHKKFDYVSQDRSVVGDAKYYTMVQGSSIPSAKFSMIAEFVWLLEKTAADQKFLVFGNDRRVPAEWLLRFGNLVDQVEFLFWDEHSLELEELN